MCLCKLIIKYQAEIQTQLFNDEYLDRCSSMLQYPLNLGSFHDHSWHLKIGFNSAILSFAVIKQTLALTFKVPVTSNKLNPFPVGFCPAFSIARHTKDLTTFEAILLANDHQSAISKLFLFSPEPSQFSLNQTSPSSLITTPLTWYAIHIPNLP